MSFTQQSAIELIKQKRFDNLATKHLHVRKRQFLNRRIRAADMFAVLVPLLSPALLLEFDETILEPLVRAAWSISAFVLLAATGIKMGFNWSGRAQDHSRLMGENISLVKQADDLLTGLHSTQESIDIFLSLATRSEQQDRDSLGEVSTQDSQFAYREALKESNVDCPVCHSSPWRFRPGSCSACGNRTQASVGGRTK